MYGGAVDDFVESVAFINLGFDTSFQVLRFAAVAFWCQPSQFCGNLLIPIYKLACQLVYRFACTAFRIFSAVSR
jgi:hypothetical protein